MQNFVIFSKGNGQWRAKLLKQKITENRNKPKTKHTNKIKEAQNKQKHTQKNTITLIQKKSWTTFGAPAGLFSPPKASL